MGVHVLVVDDDLDARQLLHTVLQYCDALVKLRALPATRGGATPAIALTAHGAGFQAHLRKPIDPWELCRAIAGLVRHA